MIITVEFVENQFDIPHKSLYYSYMLLDFNTVVIIIIHTYVYVATYVYLCSHFYYYLPPGYSYDSYSVVLISPLNFNYTFA